MYVPAHFAETRTDVLHRLIAADPLGVLVTAGPNGLDANHIPFHLESADGASGQGRLIGHVARANPLWREPGDGADVLVVFRSVDGYVSPNWYPSKHELHRQVPTWNYQVVHVHGRLRVHDDARFVRGVVARLTRTHEQRVSATRPWRMSDSDPAFIDGMLAAIVGIEVEIVRLEGKAKLSQNKEARDIRGAVDGLRSRGESALADAMAAALAQTAGPPDS